MIRVDQVTITVMADVSMSVRLVFISFVTGIHLVVPLTSALYFVSIAFVMILVLSSHNTGLPAKIRKSLIFQLAHILALSSCIIYQLLVKNYLDRDEPAR